MGNTCYMNAQLECAFHIPLIRDILHHNEEQSAGSKALLRLFQDMEESAYSQSEGGELLSDKSAAAAAAAPIALCRNLGIPVMEQQDSQEFWKLLLPALKIDELIDLYQGSYEDYITALDGSGQERRREEPFLDLSLEVASHRTILQSIGERFGSPELLSEAEGNGWRPQKGADKIDALKGSLLKVAGLPSLLQLHLKRFQYNWQLETMNKLNTRCAFPM